MGICHRAQIKNQSLQWEVLAKINILVGDPGCKREVVTKAAHVKRRNPKFYSMLALQTGMKPKQVVCPDNIQFFSRDLAVGLNG